MHPVAIDAQRPVVIYQSHDLLVRRWRVLTESDHAVKQEVMQAGTRKQEHAVALRGTDARQLPQP